ncbi:MAG: hypothetical protein RR410_06560 [Alistipes sp.]
MKKSWIIFVLLVGTLTANAQEHKRLGWELRDSLRTPDFVLPDSLAHTAPWKPDYRAMEPMKVKPKVSMSSLVVIEERHLPARVTVINNNTLRLGQGFNVSNGQAWNYSPFPDAYLDARTLSFPMRR